MPPAGSAMPVATPIVVFDHAPFEKSDGATSAFERASSSVSTFRRSVSEFGRLSVAQSKRGVLTIAVSTSFLVREESGAVGEHRTSARSGFRPNLELQ